MAISSSIWAVKLGWQAFVLLPVLFVLTLVGRQFASRLSQRRRAKALGAQPPKNLIPLKEPLLGIDYMLDTLKAAKEGLYLPFMWKRFQEFGYTYVTHRFFYDTVHTIDPENLKSMLSTDFQSFKIAETRAAAMRPLFGQGIFATDGALWAHSRALLRPSFSRNNMQPLLNMLERHFQVFLQCIPTDGSTFDLQYLFSGFTMDAATEFLMGHSAHTLDPAASSVSDDRFVADYTACCLETVRKIQMGPLQFLFPFRNRDTIAARDRAWAYIDKFVDEALDLRRKGKLDGPVDDSDDAPEYNFLYEVVRDTDDPVMLRSQILNGLLASRDTTAGLLGNFFYSISRRPDVYQKLRQEIMEHTRGNLPTDSVLKNMTYLRWCMNETLRLYPSVPANTREACADTTLPVGGGPDGKQPVFVKKGTTVLYYVFAMHRREDIFGPEVEEFRPERWNGLRPGWGFLPFNGGPRVCIGQQFALTESAYVIVRLIQTFAAIEAKDDRPWREFYTLALFSRHGVNVSVTPTVSMI